MTRTHALSTTTPAEDKAFLDVSFRSDLVGGLLVASRACVKLVDVRGALVAMNTPGQALMEIDDFAAVCGKPWAGLWPEQERERISRSVEAALEGQSTSFTAFCPTAKGVPKWWDVTVSPVRDETGAVVQVLSCSYDVTHIKEREAALQKLVEDRQQVIVSLAQQLDAETRRLSEARRRVSHAEKLHVVGQFVGNVVHDINNVLAVMQSASRVLRRRLPEGANSDIFDQVDKSVARGSTLVRRLLDFSRADGGRADVFSPSDALAGDADLLKHLVGDGIAFNTEASPNLSPVLA
ncbi:MAG TPA: PAS domain-containing protein, partial [Hyphomicrobiaceae bacterium]|nr:PAS domain-containing protein [Hyphomicrobiaceae bacterium]